MRRIKMLSIVRGDDKIFTFRFFKADLDPMDLTGCTLFVTVKQALTDSDANAKISSTLAITAPATDGVATWTIAAADTQYLLGQYMMDLQLKDSGGKIYTILRDTFIVNADATLRTV
jgi:hypothetical protein